MLKYFIAGLTVALLPMGAASAETHTSEHHAFRVVTLIEGMHHPWSIAFLPDGDWLITERRGRLRHARGGALRDAPVAGTPSVAAEGQGGLLDVVLHPDFEDNGYVYLTYAKRCEGERGNTTAVGRGVWRDGALAGFKELYAADACARGGRHHGSRLVFDRDGYMFVTVGDRGQQDRAQDPTNNIGVILRLHDDGRIPGDNPFVGDEGHDANWTFGNRNPQGMAVHPVTGEIWQNEHGPRGGDEINLVRRGANYGWPLATGGTEYDGSVITERTHEEQGFEPPKKNWTPSIAVSGMAIYAGDAFAAWRNDFFNGALRQEHLARVRFDEDGVVEEERLLEGTIGRIRDVRVGPDGFIYLLTDARDGRLVRLEPVAP